MDTEEAPQSLGLLPLGTSRDLSQAEEDELLNPQPGVGSFPPPSTPRGSSVTRPDTPSDARSGIETIDSSSIADLIERIINEKLAKVTGGRPKPSSSSGTPRDNAAPGPSQPGPSGESNQARPIMNSNPWRSCLSTLWLEDERELELVDGTRIPEDAFEFRDPSAYPETQWRRKPIAKDDPPQKEVVLLQPEGLMKAQLELVRAHKGGFTSKAYGSQGGSVDKTKQSALQVDPSTAPVLCKILTHVDEKTRDVLLHKSRPRLEETRPFQPVLLEPNPPRVRWSGFFEASLGDRLLPECADTQSGEKGFTRLSRALISDESAKRALFLNVVSSIILLELLAKVVEGPQRDQVLASIKHLLRPLMSLQIEWIKSKFDCRKQALSSMDLGQPNTQKLLYSSMFCEFLFDPAELEAAKKVAEKRCETLVSLLGVKKPSESNKRKAEEGGSANVLDKRPAKHAQKKSYSGWSKKASTPRPAASTQPATSSAPAQQQKNKPQQKSKSKASAKAGKQNV